MSFRSPAPLTYAILALPGHGSPRLGDLLQLEPPAWGRGLPAEALTSAALFQATRPGPSWRKRILAREGKRRGRGSRDSWLREARQSPSHWAVSARGDATAQMSQLQLASPKYECQLRRQQDKLGPLVPRAGRVGVGDVPCADWARSGPPKRRSGAGACLP